jgi:hypothetical protein
MRKVGTRATEKEAHALVDSASTAGALTIHNASQRTTLNVLNEHPIHGRNVARGAALSSRHHNAGAKRTEVTQLPAVSLVASTHAVLAHAVAAARQLPAISAPIDTNKRQHINKHYISAHAKVIISGCVVDGGAIRAGRTSLWEAYVQQSKSVASNCLLIPDWLVDDIMAS